MPVKFALTRDGSRIPDAEAQQLVATCRASIDVVFAGDETTPPGEPDSSDPTDSGRCFRYDAAADQFVFNLRTADLAIGQWTVRASITGPGAVAHSITIGLR